MHVNFMERLHPFFVKNVKQDKEESFFMLNCVKISYILQMI